MRNEVIIIGGSHHNGLGLVRSFGRQGIKPYGIIIDASKGRSFLQYSKYWKKTWKVKDEHEALKVLRENTINLNKSVIIPCSDGAAKMVDEHLYELEKNYILPSINGKQGEISRLMDKLKQFYLAKELGINAPETLVISLSDLEKSDISIEFPLIIKPVESVSGNKSDITVCENLTEYKNELKNFFNNGYRKVLVQHYFAKRHEYMTTAAIANKRISFSVISNIRLWPPGTGSGSFAELCLEKEVVNYVQNVLEKIADIGYSGPIDMEFFKDEKGKFYLTEFNWRSSGRNYVSMYNQCHSAFFYYCCMTGNKYTGELINDKSGYIMNLGADIQNVFARNISVKKWYKDIKKTSCFALECKYDCKPVFSQYLYYVKRFFHVSK